MHRRITLGVSLKMYLTVDESIAWAKDVAALARAHPAVVAGEVRLFVLPTLPALHAVTEALGDSPVAVGAQDLFWEESGAYTGGVSGADLVRLGCRFVAVGHAERRTVFGEDEAVIRRKFAAAVHAGLVPVLCVGERAEQEAASAAQTCIAQIESALQGVEAGQVPDLVVAYEPEWAIGRGRPAGHAHIRAVVSALREHLRGHPRVASSSVLYGGSAQPGLLTELDDGVDGLFLGRFAHDPRALESVLKEAYAIA